MVVKRTGVAVSTATPEAAPVEAAAAAPPAAKQPAPTEQDAHSPEPAAISEAPAANIPSVSDEVPEHQSFAELFDEHVKTGAVSARRSLPRVGTKVKAKIFQLGAERVFVSIGRHEAMIELDELKDEEGILRLGVGDELEAYVVETGAHGILISKKLPESAASVEILTSAKASGLPVEGLVLAVNKGGLEVSVGKVRAFCPASQVDVRPVPLDQFVGQRLTFAVSEIRDKKVVLSRRVLLEVELKAKAAELKKTLAVGQVVRGTVVSLQTFGAFIDIGGLEGLLPVSELAHQRVTHPSEVLKVGDSVEVELLRMEEAEPNSPDKAKRRERITFSMRKLLPDPFNLAAETLKEGSIVSGKVVRLQPFGAFVELAPGVDGLIHISALSDRRIAHPRDAVKVGDAVEVKVEALEVAERRVRLRLVKNGIPVGEGTPAPAEPATASPAAEKPAAKPARPRRGDIVQGKVSRIEPFGIFIDWGGFTGLIPAAETGTDRGTDLKRVFPLNKEVKAEIIEVNGEKLKLSITAAARSEERADLAAWKSTQAKSAPGGFNSLADKLKGIKLP